MTCLLLCCVVPVISAVVLLWQLMTQSRLSSASDVYSFGIIMYEMLTWKVPFEDLLKERVRAAARVGSWSVAVAAGQLLMSMTQGKVQCRHRAGFLQPGAIASHLSFIVVPPVLLQRCCQRLVSHSTIHLHQGTSL